ncbi:hypothetical protein SAY86_025399 [Trapa natans]|uniref:Uncharacterized protein n=1 Tax=Trapa natans TaxID=22666 RepID=A0AAN7M731_TRANT|nr:hypothetical protein SAY86_025399 [Trapa natans]
MAEFLPDLDDGELWVPSDIFVNDVVANNCCRNSRLSPRLFLSLDEFSRSFSSTLSQLPPRPYVDYSPLLGFGLSHNYFQEACLFDIFTDKQSQSPFFLVFGFNFQVAVIIDLRN